jgi:thiamine biosynthesis lipoprotein ApbE
MTAARTAAASWPAIGTTVRLVVTDPARLAPGRELLASYLAALDLACSRFRADSELARAERRAGTPVPVSDVLADAVAVVLDAAEATDGDRIPPWPRGWRVRVQDITGHPDDPPAGPSQLLAMTGGGVSSSGIAARCWRRGGAMLHHILDPRTGLPAPPVWRTVSALADTAVAANVTSIAAIIRGAGAPGWLESQGIPARLVAVDGSVRTVAAWPRPQAAA